MKHRSICLKTLAAAAALLLLFSSAAAQDMSFSYRNGVTWDTAPAQMLAAEDLSQGGYNEHKDNGYAFYYLIGQGAYYVFRGEQLVQAYLEQPGGAYAAELDMRTAQYGAPAAVAADTVAALINTIHGSGTVAPEELTNLAVWRLPDGTLAALFIIGGKTYTVYFNEQRIP